MEVDDSGMVIKTGSDAVRFKLLQAPGGNKMAPCVVCHGTQPASGNSAAGKRMKKAQRSIREIALDILIKLEKGKEQTREILDDQIKKEGLSSRDASLLSELTYGCVRRKLSLDWIINGLSQKKLHLNPYVKNILRLGIYQLVYLSRVPGYAAINECVNMAQKKGKKMAGFVNAILRNYTRTSKAIVFPDPDADYIQHLSVKHSHPLALIQNWISVYGKDTVEKICSINNEPPPFFARVNLLKTTRAELINLLQEEGWEVKESPFHEKIIILGKGLGLGSSESFSKGLFSIQDITALRISEALKAEPEDIIADLCSSPGGKTTALGEIMQGNGRIISVEKSSDRIKLLTNAVKRTGIKIIDVVEEDVMSLSEKTGAGTFDKVLIDVPCSNTGTLRRRVEARWKYSKEGVKRLSSTQKELLKSASQLVCKGGTLLYATCSIEPEENNEVAKWFSENFPGFKLDAEKQFLPSEEEGDGGFFARFLRIR
ncbi:MAG: 16S rRNA (cytosine(967)-C(5))-methyltransferase RsmB [Candidatus Theseobacter exili]|nr:16S rRNA (cytosine(967)-C(5))-methyltransferase RsmB [Candidatus Theseobacter exili]